MDILILRCAVFGMVALSLIAAGWALRWVPEHWHSRVTASDRVLTLDALRGFLALSVFAHHTTYTWFFLQSGKWEIPPLPGAIYFGQSAVSLFFMVTSFLFWSRVIDRTREFSWRELYISRIARLVPMYSVVVFLVLVAALVLAGGQLHQSGGDFLRAVFHWAFFTIWKTPDLNGLMNTHLLLAGVVWTLRYEWCFYLLLPAAACFVGRRDCLGAALAGFCLVSFSWWWGDGFALAVFRPFLGGVLAAYLVRHKALSSLLSTQAAMLAVIGFLSLTVYFSPSAYDWLGVLGLSVFFTAVASGNPFLGLLSTRPAIWLGEISYSMYLTHGLLLWFCFRSPLVEGFWQNQPISVYVSAVVMLAIPLVFISSATCIFVEWRGIELGRAVKRRFSVEKRKSQVALV